MGKQLEQHCQEVLQKTICLLLPQAVEPGHLVARHVWRDSDYVGRHDGKVVVWRGWRARLDAVDKRYRTLYIDVVDNLLPARERQRLFGEPSSQAVAGLPRFVVMFTLAFPLEAEADILAHGFVPRRLTRVLHTCLVTDVADFLSTPAAKWAEQGRRLLELQRKWAGDMPESVVEPSG